MSPRGDRNMRAAVYQRYGGPEVVQVEHRTAPPMPEDGSSIVVRVHAATVNRTDCGFLRGEPRIVRLVSGVRRPKFAVLGCEFAGEVVGVGEGVPAGRFLVGDRVFGFKDDDFGFGCHAEFVTMPVRGMVAPIPEGVSYEQAAASTEGAHYTLQQLRGADIKPGRTVLVNGATGAIGSAAVQLLTAMGGSVTAVCDTAGMELVKSLGAARVIDYTQEDFTQLKETFDVVFDAVGKSTFGRCKRLLGKGGIYTSTELGPWGQNPMLALWTSVFGSRQVQFPIPRNDPEDMARIVELMGSGRFKAVIDRTYPLDEIQDAYCYVETGMKTGSVVLSVL